MDGLEGSIGWGSVDARLHSRGASLSHVGGLKSLPAAYAKKNSTFCLELLQLLFRLRRDDNSPRRLFQERAQGKVIHSFMSKPLQMIGNRMRRTLDVYCKVYRLSCLTKL